MIKKKTANPDTLRLKMADLCARSEQCEYEIREKLRKQMLPSSEIEKILSFLIKERFIDNSRYAHSFTNDKVRFSGWGRNKIRQALALRRIPSQMISEALSEIDQEEYNSALFKAANAKAKNLDLEEYDDRARLYRHLLSRGYESSLISDAIRCIRRSRSENS